MATPMPATLNELKAFLNKSAASSSDDAELRDALEAATQAAEGWHGVGPIVVRTVAEQVDASDSGALVLASTPVRSVTSVTRTSDGTTYSPADLTLRKASGIVKATEGRIEAGLYDVVYEAGRDPVPMALKEAALIIAKHIWETQRGPSVTPRAEQTSAMWTGAGYLIPNRAAHLMQPYITVPIA